MTDTERALIAVMNDFPIDAWRDEPVRDAMWKMLRDEAERIARTERGWILTDDPEKSSPPQFRKFIKNVDDQWVLWPCPEEEAEMVALRLVVWSVPREQ